MLDYLDHRLAQAYFNVYTIPCVCYSEKWRSTGAELLKMQYDQDVDVVG